MNKSLAGCALRTEMASHSEVFSIATFALTLGSACIAAFVLVALGAGAEAIEYCHLDEIATRPLEALRSLRPRWLDDLDGLEGLGLMRHQMTRTRAHLEHLVAGFGSAQIGHRLMRTAEASASSPYAKPELSRPQSMAVIFSTTGESLDLSGADLLSMSGLSHRGHSAVELGRRQPV
ncbi:hypothetical protein QTI24_25180 [Variovorax sp. J22P240]|uniref:hypothetical protein n=1 Tax=Variovorax sp. J22P240 TaxID=3053514 RepID=UPI002574ACE6|nr:hypothetical protein [Variovorax sp. J22P240]MDM0001924.1 hypothetical protein [Variovorax sp. J22P240]